MSIYLDDFPVETTKIASFSPIGKKTFQRTILIPVDSATQTAMKYVLRNIVKPKDRIVLVHVRESPVDEMLAWEAAIIPEAHLEELEVKMKAESKAILESILKETLEQTKDVFIDCISIRGDPRHELVLTVNAMA